MRKLCNILLLLLLPTLGYSQSGSGYVNYKSYKTHYGNGSNSTYNGVTYSGISDNITELEAVLDVNQPGTTLTHQGEVQAYSSAGFINGLAPSWNREYYAVHHWGWFQPKETGTYRFQLSSDDASALYIDGQLIIFRPCCGTTTGTVNLTAGQWYRVDTKWQEYTGGDYMRLTYSPPSYGGSSYWYFGSYPAQLEVTNIEPVPVHKLDVTYNLKSTLDKTKFNSYIIYTDLGTATTTKVLSSNGSVSFQEGDGLNTTLYSSGNSKVNLVAGTIEFCVIYGYDATNKRYRVGLDSRLWSGTSNAPQWDNITKLKIFDLWDGVVVPKSGNNNADVHWNEYYVYTDTEFNWSGSSYQSNIRNGNGYYALKLAGNFTFEDITGFTTHKVKLDMNENYFTTTYPDMITIGDVAKGFSQLTNQTDSPNGPQGGVFTSDVEFMLGDVNGDNSFDFLDTQMLLQHLFGETSPFSTKTIDNTLLMFDGGYTNSITTNWSSKKPTTRLFTHILDNSDLIKTKSIDVAFIGDLNFSHSSALQSVGVSSKSSKLMFSKIQTNNFMILDVVKEKDVLKVTLEIPQNQNNISGTQFKLYYDESRLEFQDSEFSIKSISSFTSKRSGYINIGSFSADGSSTLNGGITYTLNFKLKTPLDSTLGLVNLRFSELVNKDGNQVIYIVR